MRLKRVTLALVFAAVTLPTVWLRSDPPAIPAVTSVTFTRLDTDPVQAGPFTLEAAWALTSNHPSFGGFSALTALSDGRLIAGTDAGSRLVFTRPDHTGPAPDFGPLMQKSEYDKWAADLESLTRDPGTGTLWGGYEGINAIYRFDADLVPQGRVRPSAMRKWSFNSGAEALARLPDGRFVAIEEAAGGAGSGAHRALVFAGDPLSHQQAETFTLIVPDGYRPVDMVAAGDNAALVLLRHVEFSVPPGFRSAIAELPVAAIAPGARVSLRMLARLDRGFPRDNYEGIAVIEGAEGPSIWLVSDDNFMRYQRTLLLKLHWNERQSDKRQKARE